MKLFKRNKRPLLEQRDFSNFSLVAEFVNWFLRNDTYVKSVSSRSSSNIYSEGIRPSIVVGKNPESYKSDIKSITEWFVIKIFLDLNSLENFSENSFHKLMDKIDIASRETLINSGSFFMEYNLNDTNFVYEKDILKIPSTKRDTFKRYFLDDNVLSSELRILMWLYYNYFDAAYTQVYKNPYKN